MGMLDDQRQERADKVRELATDHLNDLSNSMVMESIIYHGISALVLEIRALAIELNK